MIEEAKDRVTELESNLLDAKLEIDSLKAAPVVTDEIDCADCNVFLADLTALKEKHALSLEELDVLRTEVAELKTRPALLGACMSCPVLHAKLEEALKNASVLEAALKSPIATSCSSCEVVTLKNVELAHRLDVVYEENDYMRKLLGWLSGREPQLSMMIAEFKRADGRGLGFEKVGECSGESVKEKSECEKIGDIIAPPLSTPKNNSFEPKPNHMRNKLDTDPPPPEFPPKLSESKRRVSFVSTSTGKVWSGERVSEKPIRFHCGYCGKDGHKDEFCYRRKRDERMQKEWANKDRYRPSSGVPEPRVASLPRGEGSVRTIARGPRVLPARGVPAQGRVGVQFGSHFESRRGEFAGRSPPHGRYEARRDGRSFESQRHYGPRFPPRGARSPPMRFERTPPFRGERIPPFRRENVSRSGMIGRDFANPTFEQMARHWFDSFCANPSVESFAHSRSRF